MKISTSIMGISKNLVKLSVSKRKYLNSDQNRLRQAQSDIWSMVFRNALIVKRLFSLTALLLITVATTYLAGCKGNDPTPAEVTTQQLLATTWKISTVSVDGTDQTSLFTNMTLKFTATNYTTTNGGVVWPASGTWTFTDATAKKFKRDNDLEVTILEVTDTTLKLSLNWAAGTFGSGRVSSVGGAHTFNFIKQ